MQSLFFLPRKGCLLIGSFLLGCLLLPNVVFAEERLDVGRFSSAGLDGWKQKEFSGLTSYRLVSSNGQTVLESQSRQSASALYLEKKIDLVKTPVLNWSWRKNTTLNPGDESTKAGDDFVARVYVIRKGGLLFWNTKAINYVWSFQHRKGDAWDNPFAGSNARMLSVRDSTDRQGNWFSESRDVQRDFEALLGENIDSIDGIAIMTDSDNSGQSASALFGDIYFSAH